MKPKHFRRLRRRGYDVRVCAYCGVRLSHKNASRDHVVPRVAGGRGGKANIVVACLTCNFAKAGRTPAEWCREDRVLPPAARQAAKESERRHRRWRGA